MVDGRLERARWMVPCALGIAAFAAFAWCAAPGMYWLDSEELGAAGVRLGSAHPTGFPLFVLLARIASLVPVGELAFRVHLVSAACAAVAVGLTVRVVARVAGDDAVAQVAGGAAGAMLAGSATFFRQATVTEVYAPTAAAIALALWLWLRDGRRAGLVLCVVGGVAATGVHASFRLLVVPPLGVWLAWRLRKGARWVLAAPALLAVGALGMVTLAPLRSASGRQPLLDWGHPSTMGALWNHAVAAARIRSAYGSEMLSRVPEVIDENVRRFASLVEADFGAIALAAAAVGVAWLLWRAAGRGRGHKPGVRARWIGVVVVLIVAGDALYSVWVNPMGTADRQNGVPMAVGLAVCAGAGVAALARRFGRGAPFAAGAIGLIAAVPALWSAGDAKAATRSGDAARAWAESALDAAPARAIVLVQGDSTAAGLLWLGVVEGARPDVAVLVRQHLWDQRRDRAVLARVGLAAGGDALAAVLGSPRVVLWEPGVDGLPPGSVLAPGVPAGVLVRGARATPDAHAPLAAAERALARTFADGADADENARRVHGAALSGQGRVLLALGEARAAEAMFGAASEVAPELASAWVNLGVLAAGRGELARAAALTERALDEHPNDATALVNAARYRLNLGDDAAARRLATRATRVSPRRADAWTLLGIVEARAARWDAARADLERALALDPSLEEARANLEKVRVMQAGGAGR